MDHLILEVGLVLTLVSMGAILSSRLKFSTAPFLILSGLVVGSHAPKLGIFDFRFVESKPYIEFMGRIGVLFLLFYLGLEFSVTRLIRSGRSIAIGGTIYIAINFFAGLLFAMTLGWPWKEVLIVVGITTVSSSAIVAKVLFDLQRTANRETEMILGIIMFEDVFVGLYLSIISGVILSGAASVSEVLISAGWSLGFIIGFLVIGRLAVPLLNRLLRVRSNETFLLIAAAALFLLAGLGETKHVAEAIGALLVGLILAETEHNQRLEHMVVPFRDFFGALFFFSFGLNIDTASLGGAVWPALGAVVVTLMGNISAGMLAGKATGLSRHESLTVGLTIVSRGEFSIILANLALAGKLDPIVQPFAALYVLILSILGPLVTRESDRIYDASAWIGNRISARLRPQKKEQPPGNDAAGA